MEEPNVHLFLNPDINKEIEVKILIPEVNKDKCNFCGLCSKIRAYNALSVISSENLNDVIIFPQLCHGCGGCILLCPEKAMAESKRVIGKVRIGNRYGVEFIEGNLNLSEVLSPRVIDEVKKNINKNKLAVIDSPPVTSCPAVASIKGSDLCILVTEPTPFGLHDLELAYNVTKVLGVPASVVINKSEEDSIVENFCKKENIPVLLKVPFDRKIAELYSNGIPLVFGMPEYKEKFLKLYRKIKEMI